LFDVPAQFGCFQPHLTAAPVGGTLAFHPREPNGHLAQLNVQGADKLPGLGGLQSTYGVMVGSHYNWLPGSSVVLYVGRIAQFSFNRVTCRFVALAT